MEKLVAQLFGKPGERFKIPIEIARCYGAGWAQRIEDMLLRSLLPRASIIVGIDMLPPRTSRLFSSLAYDRIRNLRMAKARWLVADDGG